MTFEQRILLDLLNRQNPRDTPEPLNKHDGIDAEQEALL